MSVLEKAKGYVWPVIGAAVLFIACALAAAGDKSNIAAKQGLIQSEQNSKQINSLKKEVENKANTVPVVIVKPVPVVVVTDKGHNETGKADKPFTDHHLLERARRLRDEQKSADDNR